MTPPKPSLFKGLVVGGMFLFFGRLKRSKGQASQKIGFSTSSQRFGLHFPDFIRSHYRRKWLKIK